MRLRRLLAALAVITALVGPALLPAPAEAAGSVTVTSTIVGNGVVRYDIAWTSSAGGAVSSNSLSLIRGYLVQAQAVPGSGGTQPTDLYDLELENTNAVDLLDAEGANQSQTTAEFFQFHPAPYHDGVASLDLVIANAGNAKTGTFSLWIRGQP